MDNECHANICAFVQNSPDPRYLGFKVLFIMNDGQTYTHIRTHIHTHTHTRKFNLWFSPFYELSNNAIQRLLMALYAGYIPICNKQQTQVTEGQRKMIKKLEGANWKS